VLLTFQLPLQRTNALVQLTILHQYIGAADIKKILKILFLVLPVCNLPIGVIVTLNTLVEKCQLYQYIGGNICSKI